MIKKLPSTTEPLSGECSGTLRKWLKRLPAEKTAKLVWITSATSLQVFNILLVTILAIAALDCPFCQRARMKSDNESLAKSLQALTLPAEKWSPYQIFKSFHQFAEIIMQLPNV